MIDLAALPASIDRLHPIAGPAALGSVYRAAELAWDCADAPSSDYVRPYVALNMVTSVDGRSTLGATATGLGAPVDQYLMQVLRASADALLHGAGTIRADSVGQGVHTGLVPERVARGLPPQPLLAVLTASGDIPRSRFVAGRERTVVFVAERTPVGAVDRLREVAMVRVVGVERPDPARVLETLRREFGVRNLLCEGGATLNGTLLAAGMLDDLFLTVAPKIVGGDGLPLVVGPLLRPPMPLVPRSVYHHAGELYLRYTVGR